MHRRRWTASSLRKPNDLRLTLSHFIDTTTPASALTCHDIGSRLEPSANQFPIALNSTARTSGSRLESRKSVVSLAFLMKKRTLLKTLVGASVLACTPFAVAEEDKKAEAKPAAAKTSAVTDIKIVVKTSKGDFPATIYASKAPLTAANFLNLAKRDYYDGLKFHRVIARFMIQGGDPKGNGTGGPGYKIKDEFAPGLKHSRPGLFSMANAGPNTGGSQFFVTHVPTPHLDGKHAIFGVVTGEGRKVVDAIAKGDRINDIEILDSTDALFAAKADDIAKWNSVLGTKKK